MQKNDALQKSAAPVLKVIENPEVADRLKGAVDKQRNMELLQKEYNVSQGNRRSLVSGSRLIVIHLGFASPPS